MSADSKGTAIAADRASGPTSTPLPGTAAERGSRALRGEGPVRVAIVGATGYVGAELIRLLALHPHAVITGLVGRDRKGDPLAGIHPHLATRDLHVYDHVPDDAEAVFLALPHGVAAARIDEWTGPGMTVIDMGPDFRFRDAADYPTWYHAEHPRPELLEDAVYGLPELHRAELAAIGTKAGRHRRLAGLLCDHHDPRPGPARPRRPPRGRRRGCQERRLRRRPGPQGGPPLRRGQRERQGVRHLHPPPHRRDRAGAGGPGPGAGRQPGRARRSTSCRTWSR